eukprot:CAMPEP_0113311404 /NCGR_PEP_ID=MMETSP0010_2-20120614/8654_1 /TAXON_ID=216773 ORGANISM="Corethron hystrix, Strain 308" /NCGR_SAMPLE_ID=MMETSP0010_2 /ASSEMBLY_ACC=CAM_ASM_000155 /LENGTH=334 /DNA_ID=CAMNT_0000167035 /DNA_START=404 /DNA_END=1408 /DNA_ORIENTATION=- /assembly_acc=CAM_ASM_000155
MESNQFSPEETTKGIISRRNLLQGLGSTLAASTLIQPQEAYATVFFDPDRYGDKELKIATVNKLRQNVRSTILTDPILATQFLRISIIDALTFDASTGEGGPDGTVVSAILGAPASSPLVYLKPAATKLFEIATKIKKTTEITMADVVAFAGAESIETLGGPRITIQLGKLDSNKPPKNPSYVDLSTTDGIVNGFVKAGLSEREVALIFGAIGSMEKIVAATKKDDDDMEEENEMGDVAVFIPSSFGAPQEIYGKRIGALDNSYFESVATALKKKTPVSSAAFQNDKVGGWAIKYAGNKGGFLRDLPEAYEKLMGLGASYTGGKMGNLLDKSAA